MESNEPENVTGSLLNSKCGNVSQDGSEVSITKLDSEVSLNQTDAFLNELIKNTVAEEGEDSNESKESKSAKEDGENPDTQKGAEEERSTKEESAKEEGSSKEESAKEGGSTKEANAKDGGGSKEENAKERGSIKEGNAKEGGSTKEDNAKDRGSIKVENAKEGGSTKEENAKEGRSTKEENAKEGGSTKEENAKAGGSIKEESAKEGGSSPGEENIEAKSGAGKTASNSTQDNQRHMFHLSDNMKKGLSMLAYPSKNTSRKKGITSSRTISNSRITIGEALEKAEDAARKRMSDHLSESIKGDLLGSSSGGQVSSDGDVANSRLTIEEALEKAQDARKSMSDNLSESVKNELSNSSVGQVSVGADVANSRITIGEAPEKAQDARKIMSDNLPESVDGNVLGNSYGGQVSGGADVDKGEVQSQESKFGDKENMLGCSKVPPNSNEGNKPECEATTSNEGKREPLIGKEKPLASSRIKLTARMGELLKFTFDHEHFPSSVHMARLAKMMGVQWSQIRNWFTDQRVANKKAGIFPRDKVLPNCTFCEVELKTEPEQKNHLFSTQHVRKLLGPEYAGPTTSQESIRWKQLPEGINAISKNSGNKILAVGYVPPSKVKRETPPTQLSDFVKKDAPRSEELQKLWENSVLLGDKTENGSKTKLLRKVKRKFGDPMVTKEAEITKPNDQPSEFNDRESDSFVSNSVSQVSLPETEKMVITDNNISTLESPKQDPPMVDKGPTPETHPGDPCTSKSLQEKGTSEAPSPSGDCDIKSIPRRFIPNVIARSNNLMRKSAKMFSKESEIFKNYTPTTVAHRIEIKNGNREIPHKGQNSRVASPTFSGSSSETASENTSESNFKDSITDKLASSSETLPVVQPKAKEKQELKLNSSISQDPSCARTAVPKFIPKQVNQVKRSYIPQISRLSPLQISGVVPKEIYKSRDQIAMSRMSQQPSSVKRVPPHFQPPQTSLHSQKSYNYRHSSDDNMFLGYQCPTCRKIFQTEWLMLKHSITHLSYQCNICDQVFLSEIIFKHHMLDHLAPAYEDEKYYLQFSCKTCHSLKCECYEPTYCKPKELPKRYSRPQRAKRTKKKFFTKLNSGPNDHLRVTIDDYKKLLLCSSLPENGNRTKSLPISQKALTTTTTTNTAAKPVPITPKPSTPTQTPTHTETPSQTQSRPVHIEPKQQIVSVNAPDDPKLAKLHNTSAIEVDSNPAKSQNTSPMEVDSQITTPCSVKLTRTQTSNNVNTAPVQGEKNVSEGKTEGENQGKKSVNNRKLSSNYVYEDADDYYMCDICDASFLSKVELSEHTFFHRLKSRRRRGDKRSSPTFVEEENETAKKPKPEEASDKAEVQKISVGGFERIKCPTCKNHFASVQDLNRHTTQAHKTPDPEIKPSPSGHPYATRGAQQTLQSSSTLSDVYQCIYCEKVYRRERELRRHIKHDCSKSPKSLKDSLPPGVNITLDSVKGGPHYRLVKRNVGEHFLNEPGYIRSQGKLSPKGPITCKYCFIVTRREAEMKRHVWKYCSKVPKDIVRQFKAGVSLEDLGFMYGVKDEVTNSSDSFASETTDTDLHMKTEFNASTAASQGFLMTDERSSTPTSSPSPQPHTSSQSTVSQSPTTSPDGSTRVMTGNHLPLPIISSVSPKSKNPLVCGYCGIWYFRDQAILKHIRERCIKLPPYEKELLECGAQLCNVSQEKSVSVSLAPGSIATYKMVQVPEQSQQTIPILNVDSESNKDIKLISSEVQEKGIDTSTVSPVKEEPQTPPLSPKSITPLSSEKSTPQSSPEKNTPQSSPEKTKDFIDSSPQKNSNSPSNKKPGRKSSIIRGTKCTRCNENYKTQDAVLAHSSVHHGPKKGLYKCKLCLIKLTKYKQLREHIWEHTNETPYRCHVCLINFRSSDNLVKHLSSEHDYNLANDKNIYKWLPDRNGKYREIKSAAKNCEESLDDIETLDNLAEVMVITDSDICTSTPHKVKNSLKGVKRKLDEDLKDLKFIKAENTSAGSGLQNPILNGAKDPEDEQNQNDTKSKVNDQKKRRKVSPTKSNENKQEEDIKPNKSENHRAKSGNQTTGAERKIDKIKESRIDKVSKSERKNNKSKESGEDILDEFLSEGGEGMEFCANNSNASDKQGDSSKSGTSISSLGESFSEDGEGLISNVDTLESVIETVQLTDGHLS